MRYLDQAARPLTTMQVISTLRKAIPADRLLDVLSRAALCGEIPKYTPDGEEIPDSAEPIPPETRLKTAQYLVDKVMSDAPRLEVKASKQESEALAADFAKDASILRALPQDQLHALAAPALASLVRAASSPAAEHFVIPDADD